MAQRTMGAIQEIYADLDVEVSEEEFREAVEEKVEQMGGLADEETAAMLIAHELADQAVESIADVKAGMEEVKFLGKVLAVGDIREFERDGEEEPGRVVNVEVADETGSIRCAFWDEMAASAVDELAPGDVLRIQGRPREGYNGVEVSVDHAEPDPDATIEVAVADTYQIDELTIGRSDVTVRGQVLDVDREPRRFERDDGSEGRVGNLVIGDETGRIRVTLWDEETELLDEFSPGDTVEIIEGYVRERDGDLELHVGRDGTVEGIEADITYVPDARPIAEVALDETVDLAGVVRSADPKRTFDRDDGSEGQVKNIRVQDETDDIRVALWGEKADLEVAPGDEIQLADVEIQDGWQDELEASAGWQSTVTVLEDGATAMARDASAQTGAGPVGEASLEESASLASFENPATGGESSGEQASGEQVEFTGVVVQAGDPVVLDNGEETLSVETETTVALGEEITVSGVKRHGRLEADEVE